MNLSIFFLTDQLCAYQELHVLASFTFTFSKSEYPLFKTN